VQLQWPASQDLTICLSDLYGLSDVKPLYCFSNIKSLFQDNTFKDYQPLYLMASKRYNDLIYGLQTLKSIGNKIESDDLDILEIFVQKEWFTATEITSAIKSTKRKRAYKNVHRSMQRLKSLSLIEQTDMPKQRLRNKKYLKLHNEKFFKLTDDGIYQLFKNRVQGILVDQLSALKGQPPVSYVGQFLRNYANTRVFDLFLYPYFEKGTISLNNFGLVEKLFRYLHECCTKVDTIMRIGKVTPILIPKFAWDNIPGQDEAKLLASLKDIFSLQEWDTGTAKINEASNDRIIVVGGPNILIEIKLDLPQSKAISTIKGNIDHRESVQTYEYKVLKLASGIMVCATEPISESLRNALEEGRLLESINLPFYDLVARISKDDGENNTALAKDIKFMNHLENLRDRFELGYQHLIDIRRNLR
jgi:hypothetical protein